MNRCIRVLQTHALPLGYCAMIKKYGIDLSKFWHITEWVSSGVADLCLTTWLLRHSVPFLRNTYIIANRNPFVNEKI